MDNNNTIGFSSNAKTVSDGILNRAISGLKTMTEETKDLENMEEVYGSILHNTIIKKLSEGKLKNIGNLSKDQNFLSLMFTRALKGKKTKIILYIPKELGAYNEYLYSELSKYAEISNALTDVDSMYIKAKETLDELFKTNTMTGQTPFSMIDMKQFFIFI